MNIEELRDHCLSLPATTEGFPFGEDTLVFKVANKVFVLTSLSGPLSINLKCDPEKGVILRERYGAVKPGYHMNKKHWNTIMVDGTVDDRTIRRWIEDSYHLVFKSLPKKTQQQIKEV